MEKTRDHALQDQRRQSRIPARIECQFKSGDNEQGALMLDLSQGGAFLSSKVRPPKVFRSDSFIMTVYDDPPDAPDESIQTRENSQEIHLPRKGKISITIEGDDQESPLTISGTIIHGAISELGSLARFGIEFENTPQEITRLIASLSADADVGK